MRRRSEQEMMDAILAIAREDERVRVVGLNGSRANPHARKDAFQDFDIAFLVTDMAPFLADHSWVDVFGRRIIMQMPEAMTLYPPSLGGWFTYLMLFEDGNRIDLMLIPVKELQKYLRNDSQTVILLDKDGHVPPLPPPDDSAYHVKKPSEGAFTDCCNEFWWVSTYVAKGLLRGELLYAAWHMEQCVRRELLTMLSWRAGMQNGFGVSVGKCCKDLRRFLTREEWETLCLTYRLDEEKQAWQALWAAVGLFRAASRHFAQGMGYGYPDYDEKVTRYLQGLCGMAPAP